MKTYQERGVSASRLHRVTAQDVQKRSRRKRPVGKLIQNAINRLKQDILVRESGTNDRSEPGTDTIEMLPDVDALVDRLRETEAGRNLLADESSFADFAFHNLLLLRTNWLQVVDHVRHGTRFKPVQENGRPANAASWTPLSFLDEKFGFRDDDRKKNRVHPMPGRAELIELQFIELGFARDPNSDVSRAILSQILKKTDAKSCAQTSRSMKQSHDNRITIQDDATMDEMYQRVQTSQELHQLAYELKVCHFISWLHAIESKIM